MSSNFIITKINYLKESEIDAKVECITYFSWENMIKYDKIKTMKFLIFLDDVIY